LQVKIIRKALAPHKPSITFASPIAAGEDNRRFDILIASVNAGNIFSFKKKIKKFAEVLAESKMVTTFALPKRKKGFKTGRVLKVDLRMLTNMIEKLKSFLIDKLTKDAAMRSSS
jgi:hypothetical protein